LPRTRKSAPELTADQRRRQIIDILSAHLARMPAAIEVPPKSPQASPDSGAETARQNLRGNPETGLELSAN